MSYYYPEVSSLPNRAVAPHVRALLADLTHRFGEPERVARSDPDKPWVLVFQDQVVYLASTADAGKAVEQELGRLQWAREWAIPVPGVIEIGEFHFVVERAARDLPRGATYVSAAIDAADRIAAADPPELPRRSGRRRSPRRTIPRRAIKMAGALINPLEFVRVRRRTSLLTRDTLSHGDFHPNNVLFDSARGTVSVIDWSYFGYQPRFTDLLYFWARLEDPADRAIVFRSVVDRSDDLLALADLHHWIALRTLIEAATERSLGPGNRDWVVKYHVILKQARANAAALRESADVPD